MMLLWYNIYGKAPRYFVKLSLDLDYWENPGQKKEKRVSVLLLISSDNIYFFT